MPRRRPAFTLIELLVVVAVISLLMSILLPSLQRARAQARNVECLSMHRQISLATMLYASENRGYCQAWRVVPMVTGGNNLGLDVQVTIGTAMGPQVLIGHGLIPPRYWDPPLGTFPGTASATWDHGRTITWRCPEYGRYPGETSYAYNTGGYVINPYLSWQAAHDGSNSPWRLVAHPPLYDWNERFSLHKVRRAAAVVLWADASGAGSIHFAQFVRDYHFYPESVPGTMTGVHYRHLDGINLSFVDGHAEHYSRSELGSGRSGIESYPPGR